MRKMWCTRMHVLDRAYACMLIPTVVTVTHPLWPMCSHWSGSLFSPFHSTIINPLWLSSHSSLSNCFFNTHTPCTLFRVILLSYDWSYSSSICFSLLSSIIEHIHHSRFSVSIPILRIERLLSVANTTHNRWIALLYHRYTLHSGTSKNPLYSFNKQLYKTILSLSRLRYSRWNHLTTPNWSTGDDEMDSTT